MNTKCKPEKKQHIQVFTRVRPLSTQELRSQVVVECINSKEVSVRDKSQTKTFTFDRVFGPDSKQVEVYQAVVSPLISEVLRGYNCTVFAYGQTGTGKTFTMVGGKTQGLHQTWEDDPLCGVIPRTLSHLFDELKMRADEFTVRVSFLELYNEELCDLLAPNDNDDGKNLKLFEDSMKKGSVIVSGLEERTVHNKDDVYPILEAGNLRRQTAPTLMNAQSSRSHTIFTITVHIKVTTPEGEDLIKTGKLNLVDLAGSENIGRSGAVDMRAREAGNINQSLLTLGRVITSLVERAPHVPYRESKLTRILQDSLGGRTKTSIIATVSPALCNIEETLSTFDYAHRARNITNKPEINQKTSKRVLLKEYTEEIERLRRDLIATREKHGVYLASDNYNAIMAERENLNKELISKLQLLKVREDELVKQEGIMKSLNMSLFATQSELAVTSQKLREAKQLCIEREDMLHELTEQTNILLKTTDEAVNDAKNLHDRLDRSRRIHEHNINSIENFKNKFCLNLGNMKSRTKEFLAKGVNEVETHMDEDKQFLNNIIGNQTKLREVANKAVIETNNQMQSIIEVFTNQNMSLEAFFAEQLAKLNSVVDSQNHYAHQIISDLMDCSQKMKLNCSDLFENMKNSKKTVEKQMNILESSERKLSEVIKIVTAYPMLLNENMMKQREELRHYVEKCEFLEKKLAIIQKQNEEFETNLHGIAQNYSQRLQNEKECIESLINLRDKQKSEEEILYETLMSNLQENASSVIEQINEIEKFNKDVKQSTAEMMEITDIVTPLVSQVVMTEEKCTHSVDALIKENSCVLEDNISKLKQSCEREREKNMKFFECFENRSSEAKKLLESFNTEINNSSNQQTTIIEKAIQNSLVNKQVLSSRITDHSEELFSNIHDRMKEIETFFSEGFKRDEKTGNTPQRKDFNYSRRIIGFSNSNRMNITPEKEENSKSELNIFNGDILSESKENICNSGDGADSPSITLKKEETEANMSILTSA